MSSGSGGAALTHTPLSDAPIGNLERLSRCIDAGFLKDQNHEESIKKHAMANKVVDEQFWSHIERMAGLLSSGIFTTEDHQQQIQEKVEALLRTGESRSIAASGRAAEGGGSSVPEKIRPAKKEGAKRGSAEARAAANTRHGNIINFWAEATQQPVGAIVRRLLS